MRKCIKALLWIAFLSATTNYSAVAQNETLMNNNLYKNVVKYYEQAENFYTQGNTKDAKKRLQYADQFAQKLVKAGYEAELQDYLKKIQEMQQNLVTNGSSNTTKIEEQKTSIPSPTGHQMSREEWRKAVNEVTKLEGQIRNLFNFLPAHANLTEPYKETVATLNGDQTKQTIQELKNQSQAQQAYHKSYVKGLDRVLDLITDLDAGLAASNFSNNLASTCQYIASGARGQ
ncbi:MAG: hypothetical protein AAF242_15735, partial [Bacteroidota bacterium]